MAAKAAGCSPGQLGGGWWLGALCTRDSEVGGKQHSAQETQSRSYGWLPDCRRRAWTGVPPTHSQPARCLPSVTLHKTTLCWICTRTAPSGLWAGAIRVGCACWAGNNAVPARPAQRRSTSGCLPLSFSPHPAAYCSWLDWEKNRGGGRCSDWWTYAGGSGQRQGAVEGSDAGARVLLA